MKASSPKVTRPLSLGIKKKKKKEKKYNGREVRKCDDETRLQAQEDLL